ncbi:hypothetical protein SISSUDRAFT_1127570 [Sistotremastrum suecicum HHB10207 ss-3]|uniref:RNI-like protein n=1 Tax=Sistotremastrum suecicum HHB10207 ss-3 TaxID=1314776 RepID=A0A166EV82_9AGAM|nr:hypothetical protein SISSUDRAFT_1127570 [Sistotremastrum suecicum HHB10207 ss-3]
MKPKSNISIPVFDPENPLLSSPASISPVRSRYKLAPLQSHDMRKKKSLKENAPTSQNVKESRTKRLTRRPLQEINPAELERTSGKLDYKAFLNVSSPIPPPGLALPPMKPKCLELSSDSGFSELQGPLKRGQSVDSVDDESFILSAKADKIHFISISSNESLAHDQPVSPSHFSNFSGFNPSGVSPNVDPISPDTHEACRRRIAELEAEVAQLFYTSLSASHPIPIQGSQVREHIRSLTEEHFAGNSGSPVLHQSGYSYQDMIDSLIREGRLDTHTLTLFGYSEVESISFSQYLRSNQSLPDNTLRAFQTPHLFTHLKEVVLSGIHLQDQDVFSVASISCLKILHLGSCRIRNDSICYLRRCQDTLESLDLHGNPEIDDGAVPDLNHLRALKHLSLLETRVTVVGLKSLAANLRNGHNLKLLVPEHCRADLEGSVFGLLSSTVTICLQVYNIKTGTPASTTLLLCSGRAILLILGSSL